MTDQQIINELKETLNDFRPKLLDGYGNIEAQEKKDHTLVTKLDTELETVLRNKLQNLLPGSNIVGEELGGQESESFWLIDPIDGTDYFVRGLPECTSLVSRIENGQVTLAIIYDFVSDRFYHAIRGHGAYVNDKKISVSSRPIERSIVIFESKSDWEQPQSIYKIMCEKGWGVNVFCMFSSGVKWAQLAEGVIEGIVLKDSWEKPWDVAAGSLLVTEAGGTIKNIKSDSYEYSKTDLIVATPAIFGALDEIIR